MLSSLTGISSSKHEPNLIDKFKLDAIFKLRRQYIDILEIERSYIAVKSSKDKVDSRRLVSESKPFHYNALKVIESNGKTLAFQLTKEYESIKLASTPAPSSEVIRQQIQSYMDSIPHSTHRNDKAFPWRQCDESAENTCEMLLDKGDVESCRLYVHGYLECICSVPTSIMSNQGLAFHDRAACILKRHPYSGTFSSFLIALAMLIDEQVKENMTRDYIIGIVDVFVKLSTEAWVIWFVLFT